MVAALYIVHWQDTDNELELLVGRRYNWQIPHDQTILSLFQRHALCGSAESGPILHIDGLDYIFIRRERGIYVLAVAKSNINVMLMIVFLHELYNTINQFLADAKRLDRDSIRDNLTLILDLIDECMDFGVVQLSDYNLLKEYIKVGANHPSPDSDLVNSDAGSDDDAPRASKRKGTKKKHQKSLSTSVKSTGNHAITTADISQDNSVVNSAILRTYSLAINWRPKGIFYAKNEIYIDLIENCDFLYDLSSGYIQHNEVYGTCSVKSYLSGMPVCTIGFNESRISGIESENYGFSSKPGNMIAKDGLGESLFELDDEDQYHEDGSVIKETESATVVERSTNINDIAAKQIEGCTDINDTAAKQIEGFTDINDTAAKQIEGSSDINDIAAKQTEGSTDIAAPLIKRKRRRIPIRNIQFHQCVSMDALYTSQLVTFVPPDNEFVLMTYNVEQQRQHHRKPLIMVDPTFKVLVEQNKLQVMVEVRTEFNRRLHCRGLIIRIPIDPRVFLPQISTSGAAGLRFKAEHGDVTYRIDASELCWHIEDVTGKKTVRMMAEIDLQPQSLNALDILQDKDKYYRNATTQEEHENPTDELDRYYGVGGANTSLAKSILQRSVKAREYTDIKMGFSIPLLSLLGLRLEYLKVEEEPLKYTCFPWIRYTTESTSKGRTCAYRFKLGVGNFEVVAR